MTHRLGVVIFPGFQLLDAAGPISTFEIAGRYAAGSYEIRLFAPEAGLTASSSGAALMAEALTPTLELDTLMVVGGDGTRRAEIGRVVAWLQAVAPRTPRLTSVCSGAWLLAHAGLLDGRAATTHWSGTAEFARRYPTVRLQPDRIFVRDGHVWTSAGITAGIDLALALIEEDLGQAIARRTARQLVVHHRRGGGQSQFSALPDVGAQNGRFAELLDWVRERVAEPLPVERLAEQAAMSPRNFARAFRAETGLTPAKAVERLRLETARACVEASHEPIERIAEASGFNDPERMRRAFVRAYGQPPQALRRAARG